MEAAGMELLIYKLRTKQRLSLIQLSDKTGISKSALNYYENGIRYPNMEQMERIAKALKVRIEELYHSDYK